MRTLPQIWKEWEIQLTVLLSFVLQVFLLITGCLVRRNSKGLLRVLIWLAYVGADAVAVFGLGLISHYNEKCVLRSSWSFGDAQPFLWISFLLVHLGGQDSITAYSIEDNNLWLRHLLNLGIQGALALYIFWKSIHTINSQQVLIPAAFTFISGIIKYGERIWALRNGSRGGLGKSEPDQSLGQNNYTPLNNPPANMNIYSYALRTVLRVRGLFIGRTVLQLGHGIQTHLVKDFLNYREGGMKLKIIRMELGMMFDLLYTKAMVLQRWVGCIFRCASQILMVVAFMIFHNRVNAADISNLFLIRREIDVYNNHKWVNIVITYTLFIGAILMETFSVATVLASPWTRVHLREGSFLHWLFISINACSNFMAIQCNKMMPSDSSIGQFNHIDFISSLPKSRVLCSIISALGLGEQWKTLCCVERVEAKGIFEYIERWFDRPKHQQEQIQFQRRLLQFQGRLNYILCLPFEHALYRLHIFTDLHISRHFDPQKIYSDAVMRLKEDCEKLSNYIMYLRLVHPSMLPISVAVHDGKLHPREAQLGTRLQLLEQHADFEPRREAACPFDHVQTEQDLMASLEDIKEIWTRLLVYAAGKCGGEEHARQLGEGGELLSFVWLLMLHHGLGDAATEYKLLISDDPNLPQPGTLVTAAGNDWTQKSEGPRYAFDFRHRRRQDNMPPSADPFVFAGIQIPDFILQVGLTHSGASPERTGAGTSSMEEIDEAEPRQDIPY